MEFIKVTFTTLNNGLNYFITNFLFFLVRLYDEYVYTPMQKLLTPVVLLVPRDITINHTTVTIFTANIVTYSRTLLVIPIAYCLKFNYFVSAAVLVAFHDFLDHLDGIVAKAQKKVGYNDDPLFGAFLDAFCDKIVITTSLWTILFATNYETMDILSLLIYLFTILTLIAYEIAIGSTRVGDYFYARYVEKDSRALNASMEGKLKEKLESMGVAFLCVAIRDTSPFYNWWGISGIICIALSIRMAHTSLSQKLEKRKLSNKQPTFESVQVHKQLTIPNTDSPSNEIKKVDKVYSVGCFDMLSKGHEVLFTEMQKLGKNIIIGIHDDASMVKLKNRDPKDNLETRLANVKKYADQVFIVPSADPEIYILAAISLKEGETALYVRGDDSLNFPARSAIEKLMPIKFLPYIHESKKLEDTL